MGFSRASGLLLHVTSIPGSPGIGDMGPAAEKWIDFLYAAGQRYWQILPLGPTGYGDSPYQSFSAFAGNPLLVSPERLIEEGLVDSTWLSEFAETDPSRVDFGRIVEWKQQMLREAFLRFAEHPEDKRHKEFTEFIDSEKYWLEDYALYRAIKAEEEERPWWEWTRRLRLRDVRSLASARQRLANEIRFFQFKQWLFFRQWTHLRAYAHSKAVHIIGDLPIFVAHDSADAWAHPDLFCFDKEGNPTIVAGVPPDYFSPTGQLWGNPIYRWEKMAEAGFPWWISRFKALYRMVDVARIDHFRGFDAYWAVPAGSETAENGSWESGPGARLFETIRAEIGPVPVIAEDLGFITPSVVALREKLGYPGMHILQFAFVDDGVVAGKWPEYPFLPHTYEPNSVCYTGTHDNDTTEGWFAFGASDEEKRTIHRYLGDSTENISTRFVRLAWTCPSRIAIAPVQDLLQLGNDARMNLPGTLGDNWHWRCPGDALSERLAANLLDLTIVSGRLNAEIPVSVEAEEIY